MKHVEILAIGNELLRGIVQETNSYWLAVRITARGAALRRVTILPDEPPVVAEELRAALARGAALVVTHGGLGPTDDDRTRQALALALDVPLARDEEAEAIVRRRFGELASEGRVPSAEPNASALGMARIPRGARALDNQVGTAPGLVLRAGATTIVALPGVPPEMKWIWEQVLDPLLDELLGPGGSAERTAEIAWHDESRIAELLAGLQSRHPEVYVKSRASGFGAKDRLRVTIAASAEDADRAAALAEQALGELVEALGRVGIVLGDDVG